LHDMGKPECHQIRVDKHGTTRDSFSNHQIASEKIALRALPYCGFNKSEINIVAKLVLEHDFFMYLREDKDLTSNKILLIAEEKIKEFSNFKDPKKINKMLIMVGMADNLAQNPELTQPSIELIKQYENISLNIKSHAIDEK